MASAAELLEDYLAAHRPARAGGSIGQSQRDGMRVTGGVAVAPGAAWGAEGRARDGNEEGMWYSHSGLYNGNSLLHSGRSVDISMRASGENSTSLHNSSSVHGQHTADSLDTTALLMASLRPPTAVMMSPGHARWRSRVREWEHADNSSAAVGQWPAHAAAAASLPQSSAQYTAGLAHDISQPQPSRRSPGTGQALGHIATLREHYHILHEDAAQLRGQLASSDNHDDYQVSRQAQPSLVASTLVSQQSQVLPASAWQLPPAQASLPQTPPPAGQPTRLVDHTLLAIEHCRALIRSLRPDHDAPVLPSAAFSLHPAQSSSAPLYRPIKYPAQPTEAEPSGAVTITPPSSSDKAAPDTGSTPQVERNRNDQANNRGPASPSPSPRSAAETPRALVDQQLAQKNRAQKNVDSYKVRQPRTPSEAERLLASAPARLPARQPRPAAGAGASYSFLMQRATSQVEWR